ncbi:Transcriptional activator CadC [compost metagenome]|jgi:DNA-binding winged helix-turn-helix (wHTH) protein|uniref:Winged helix-turn-helix domain-containing protein n=1 Tax=Silvania hatchlandensis TaxID=2926469 RepID=A0A9J6PVY9_9ENTR|nr:winged helix-turn-helix domain-containing protein [Silvania hatchlandensis]MCU6663648.1 winged helix-turn-helix domain-containing protein [Silvania hatchlandensis]
MTFNKFIINNEVIFDMNINELQPLTLSGSLVTLNAPTARCLQLFLEHKGKVISREEFLDSVWKTRGVVVSENTFYQNISLLRKSLARAGLSQEIIVTIRQRGFRIAQGTDIIPVSEFAETLPAEADVSLQGGPEVNEIALEVTPVRSKDSQLLNKKEQNGFFNKWSSSLKLSILSLIIVSIMTMANLLILIF